MRRRIMLEKKYSGLPVVDKADHLAGISAESDIFHLVATVRNKE
jgi:CBS domain-containing protein